MSEATGNDRPASVDVAIVGAGAAGLFAAHFAGKTRPDASIVAKGYGAMTPQISVNRNPEAKILKRPVTVDASVSVCGECGAVELRADEPHKLWEAYMEGLSRGWD